MLHNINNGNVFYIFCFHCKNIFLILLCENWIVFNHYYLLKYNLVNEELKGILEKVLSLYLKYGIKSITMDDVARELGISKKTLYQYVCDKTDLVTKVVELEMEQRSIEFQHTQNPGLNAIEELVEVHKHLNQMMKRYNPSTDYDLRKYYPDLYKRFYDEKRKKMYEWVLANLKKGKEEGLYRAEMNEDIITKMTVMRSEIFHDNELLNISELTSTDFFIELMIYHIRGIANEKGIKELERILAANA